MRAPMGTLELFASRHFSGVHLPPQCSVTELRFLYGFGVSVQRLKNILTNLPALRCLYISCT